MADIGGLIGGVIGGALGAGAASGDIGQSREAADAAYKQILSLGAPPDLAKSLLLQQYKDAGQLTPDMEQYIQAGPAQTISQDSGVRNQQLEALNLLSQRANGGLTSQDRANLNQVRNQIGSDTQAKLGQIMQNAQARGQAGGGSELAAALSAAQGGSNQASQAGDRLSAMASQNALNAAVQSGQMAGQLRGQDTSINSQNANIANEMNRFNTQNQIASQRANTQAKNSANLYNTQQAQNASNLNTAQQNQEQQRQVQAQQQNWLNQNTLAQEKANTLLGKSNDFKGRAQATINQNAGIGSAIGQLGGMAMGAPSTGGGAGTSTTVAGGPGDAGSGGLDFSNYAYDGGMVTDQGTIDHGNDNNNGGMMIQSYSTGGEVKDAPHAMDSREDKGWGAIIVKGGVTNGRNEDDGTSNIENFAFGGPVEPLRSRPNQPLPTNVTDYDATHVLAMLKGGVVPGKAKVKGDSPKNDTVHAKLSPGEMVIPRSIAQHQDAPIHAAMYVAWLKKLNQENHGE